MTHTEINSFLDCPLHRILYDGQLDAIFALHVYSPGSSLYVVLDSVIKKGLESFADSEIEVDISHYIKSAINPEMPW